MTDPSIARRRVVPNACNECRKKRTKCDGELPCSRCESREGVVCIYEPHLKQSKEVIQAELNRIRGEWQSMDVVLRLLKTHEHPQTIIDELKSGKPLALIAGYTERESASGISRASPDRTLPASSRSAVLSPGSESTENASSFVSYSSPSRSTTTNASIPAWSAEGPGASRPEPAHLFLENRHRLRSTGKFPSSGWTSVTSNDNLVDHLLALYFCWEYPTFASLSKEHFIYDFSLGTERFCSSLLVNTLLALGARSSDAPEARKYPSDPLSAGEHFFEEAKRLLGSEEVPTLPMIQALGLMSLRQASCGNDASSVFYARQSLRMALDIDLHRRNPASKGTHNTPFSQAEREVRTATFWGCFNLEQAWALCIGRPSQVVPGDIEIAKPEEVDEIENEDWKPYTDAGTVSRDYHQPNNVRTVYGAFSQLSEIINEGAYDLNSASKPLESNSLLSAYHRLLEWYDALPDQLRLGTNFTPTVLFTHMYYHFAILILFRPFRNLNITGSATSPKKICTEASQNLFTLIKSYKDLYTLRRVPSFVPYMILTANLAHLVDSATKAGDATSNAIEFASLSYLDELRSTHFFAKRALDIVDYFSEMWGLGGKQPGRAGDTAVHPANNVAGTDTFFLPASRSALDVRPEAGNASMPRQYRSLFPQQGRR